MNDQATTAPDPITAPAVHSDTMWGGPQWVEHLGHDPVWVETKAQYFDELNRRGLKFKHMQESTTGPERLIVDPEPVGPPPIRSLTAADARLMRQAEYALKRYALIEAVSCNRCFALSLHDGCRVMSGTNYMQVECRCGVRAYQGERGVDLGGSAANTTTTLLDHTEGIAFSPDGDGHGLPTTLLDDQTAKLLTAYVRMLASHQLSVRWFCRGCWDGQPLDGHDCQKALTDEKVVLLCRCRIRFWQG
jgi:hypothetical protein